MQGCVHGSATMIDYVKPIQRLHGEFESVMWLTQTLFIVASVNSSLIEAISRKQAHHMMERLQDRRARAGHVGQKYHQRLLPVPAENTDGGSAWTAVGGALLMGPPGSLVKPPLRGQEQIWTVVLIPGVFPQEPTLVHISCAAKQNSTRSEKNTALSLSWKPKPKQNLEQK